MYINKKQSWALGLAFLTLAAWVPSVGAENAATSEASASPTEWIRRSDRLLRGDTSVMDVTLTVHTSAWERVYKYRSYMQGTDRTFVRITDPSRFKGQGFLKLDTRLWNYLPTAERTILIPPSLMLDDFMGSDFSNDDLVKMSYLVRDYTHEFAGNETLDGDEVVVIRLLPRPEAAVVHGKLMIWLRTKDAAPVKVEFYDFKMGLVRTLYYSDFRAFNDREYPSIWKVVNHRKPGNETTIRVESATFNEPLDESIFTKHNLENP